MEWVSALPTVNATLNATTAVLLAIGFVFIKQKNIKAHRACMIAAFSTSVLFLICYLTYHYYHGATKFPGEGWSRPTYFSILISHTILATVIVPFVLVTLWRALSGQFFKHSKIARLTLPVWLYVSVTGVLVYLMLYHFYPVHQAMNR